VRPAGQGLDGRPVGAIAIGEPSAEPDEQTRARLKDRRRSLDDVVRYGHW